MCKNMTYKTEHAVYNARCQLAGCHIHVHLHCSCNTRYANYIQAEVNDNNTGALYTTKASMHILSIAMTLIADD